MAATRTKVPKAEASLIPMIVALKGYFHWFFSVNRGCRNSGLMGEESLLYACLASSSTDERVGIFPTERLQEPRAFNLRNLVAIEMWLWFRS